MRLKDNNDRKLQDSKLPSITSMLIKTLDRKLGKGEEGTNNKLDVRMGLYQHHEIKVKSF